MTGFHYVYTLQSVGFHEERHTGQTEVLQKGLAEHNAVKVPHTSEFAPGTTRSATAVLGIRRRSGFRRRQAYGGQDGGRGGFA